MTDHHAGLSPCVKSPVLARFCLTTALLGAFASGGVCAVVTSGNSSPTTSTAAPLEAGVVPKAPRPAPGGKIEIGPLDIAPDESLVNGSGLRKAFPAPSGVAAEEVSKVPEPASIGFGLLGLLAILRRRQK